MNTEQSRQTRITPQRQLVFDHVSQTGDFRTAQQVHAALRADGHSIGLATVYRALQGLTEAGMIDTLRKIDGEVAYRRCSPAHHHHLICRNCGRAVEVSGDELERWSQRVAASHGFRNAEHFVEVYGICADC